MSRRSPGSALAPVLVLVLGSVIIVTAACGGSDWGFLKLSSTREPEETVKFVAVSKNTLTFQQLTSVSHPDHGELIVEIGGGSGAPGNFMPYPGGLIYGSSGNRLLRYDIVSKTIEHISLPYPTVVDITALAALADGSLLGAMLSDGGESSFFTYQPKDNSFANIGSQISGGIVLSLIATGDLTAYFGTDEGKLYLLDVESGDATEIATFPLGRAVTALTHDKGTNRIYGMPGFSYSIDDPGTGVTELSGLASVSEPVYDLVVKDGVIYCGGFHTGEIYRYDPATDEVETLGSPDPEGLTLRVRGIALAGDYLYGVADGGELNRFQGYLFRFSLTERVPAGLLKLNGGPVGFRSVCKGDDGLIYTQVGGSFLRFGSR